MPSLGLLGLLLACFFIIKVHGQLSGQLRHAVKSGSCPPNICVSVFDSGCQSDFTCPREMKCCPNQCGRQMCMPPISSEERRSKQKLHVSFIQETTTAADRCYYNGQWYNPGQQLVSRDGAYCTCINREQISCTRPNAGGNNNVNVNYNNQGQSNALQSNFRMAQNRKQTLGGYTTPGYQWKPPTSQPVQVFIQDMNNIPGQSQYGLNPAMNRYHNLGEMAGAATPAFFQKSHVKEAQSQSVITEQNVHEPAHRQQMLYDKNYPTFDKSASLNSGSLKAETRSQFGLYEPYLNRNVNFGLPSKNEGNILQGPITTEISIVKDSGLMGMQQNIQGVTKSNKGYTSTTASWLKNTGVSKNVIESLEFGVLERNAGFISQQKNSKQSPMQNIGYSGVVDPSSALHSDQIHSFNQPNSNPAFMENADFVNGNHQSRNNNQNQFQPRNPEFLQQISMPPVAPVQAPFQQGNSWNQESNQQFHNGQGLNKQLKSIDQLKSSQKVNSQPSFGSFAPITNERNKNTEEVYHNNNPNLSLQSNQNYPMIDNSGQRNPVGFNNHNSWIPQQVHHIDQNNNNKFEIQPRVNPINGHNYDNSRISQQSNPNVNYNEPNTGIQVANNNNNPNLGIPPQTFNNQHSSFINGNLNGNNPTDQTSNINQNYQPKIPMNQGNYPQTSIAENPSEPRSNVMQVQNQKSYLIQGGHRKEQNTRIQLKNTRSQFGDNAAFNADNLLLNQENTNRGFDTLDSKNHLKSFSLQANTRNENRAKKFNYNNGQPINTYKTISFDNMHSETDLRLFNRQQSRVTPFSLKEESIKVENSIKNPGEHQVIQQTEGPTTIFPDTDNIKIGTDTPTPLEEIIIETTLPPSTSTKSFIQFLKEVIEQRGMVKSKAQASPADSVYNKEMVKSKKEVQPPANPVHGTKELQKSTLKKMSSSTRIAETSTPPTTKTTGTSTTMGATDAPPSNSGITTVSSIYPTQQSIPTTTIKVKEVTETSSKRIRTSIDKVTDNTETSPRYNNSAKSRTLKSLLAEMDKQTTIRIKVVPIQNATPDTRQTYVVYMSPSPKTSTTSTSAIPTTTFSFINNLHEQLNEFKDNSTRSEPKEPRIHIMTESTTLPVTTMIEKPMSENPGQKSQGTTNSHFSHFQFTDTATQRMDVVDQSRDIPINNPSTTMSNPIDSTTSQQLYQETPIVYTSNSHVQNSKPIDSQSNIAQEKHHPQLRTSDTFVPDVLPENATFYQKIVFMRRQKEARENPLKALNKYGSQTNMLHLINMLPKNNYNPMAAKNVAEFYTVKDRPRPKPTAARASITTPSPNKKERSQNNAQATETRPSQQSVNIRTGRNGNVLQSRSNRGNVIRNNRKNNVQQSQTQTRQRNLNSKKPPTNAKNVKTASNKNLKQKINSKQCVYLGKVYKINQRFRNDKGQRCRCRKGGKVKCRR